MKTHKLLSVTLLAGGLLFCSILPAVAQQRVTMTTAKAAGEQLTLAVNRTTAGFTVDWGDGVPVTYTAGTEPIQTLTGTVKGATLVVSGDAKWHTLICENAGLTALDVSEAVSLRSLYCQNNSLTTLELTGLTALRDLDCSGNAITALRLTTVLCPLLENINLADNSMEKIGASTAFVFGSAKLQHLNLSGNRFKSVYVTSNTQLDALQVAGNALIALNVSRDTLLTTLVAHGNSLSALTLPTTGLPYLQQAVLDDNALTTLDLSASTSLSDLSCARNGLTALTLPSRKLTSLHIGGNALTFTNFPKETYRPDSALYVYAPQAELNIDDKLQYSTTYGGYYIPMSPAYRNYNNPDYQVDLSAYRLDGDGKANVVYAWYAVAADGTETLLQRATSPTSTNEYTMYLGKFTFLKEFSTVYARLSHAAYPKLVLKTSAFAVGEGNVTGLAAVASDDLGLSTAAGRLTLTGNGQTVSVYDAGGKLVWHGKAAGTVSVELPAGVYVVNGKKVIL